MKYTIDAADKKIGRIASEAASCLMGKKSTSFAKNAVADAQVEIINAKRAYITAKKKEGGVGDDYVTYTGHRGGLCTIHAESSAGAFTKIAVYGLLAPERLPQEATNLLVANAVHFVVHLRKLADGTRVVSSIREVTGADGLQVQSNEIFAPGPDGRPRGGAGRGARRRSWR